MAEQEVKNSGRFSWFKKTLLVFLVIVVVGVLGVVAGNSLLRRFPSLEPGSYIGSISGISSSGPATLYLERAAGTNEILFVVFAPGFQPQTAISIPSRSITRIDTSLPIAISGEGGTYTFYGTQDTSNSFHGGVEGPRGVASWVLSKVVGGDARRTISEESDLKLWLMLRAELEDTTQKVAALQTQVPRQREEIERLTAFVTQGDLLRSRAQEKFAAIQEELTGARNKFKARQREAQRLDQAIEISQKVKGLGKLTQLARDSLEREGRWIESMSRTSSDSLRDEVSAELERAKRILDVRDQVEVERKKLEVLRTSGVTDGNTPVADKR